MDTLNILLASTNEDNQHIKRLNKFLDTITYRKDVYEDPKLYQLIFKELELYHEFSRVLITSQCLRTLRSSLSFINGNLDQIYEAIPLDLISSISTQPPEVQEALISVLYQLLTLLSSRSLLDAPNELFICIIEVCLNRGGSFKLELVRQCQDHLIHLIESSSQSRCRLGSVGALSCLISLHRQCSDDSSSSRARQLCQQVYSAILKMFDDSNSRVRMTSSDSEIIDIVFARLKQPMKSAESLIIAESLAAICHFQNSHEGQSFLIHRGLLFILQTYLRRFKEIIQSTNKYHKAYSANQQDCNNPRHPTNSRNDSIKFLFFMKPVLYQLINLFSMISFNEKLRHHLCHSDILDHFVLILKQDDSCLSASKISICKVLRNIFKCVTSLEAIFRSDFLYQFIKFSSPNRLDLSKINKSSHLKRSHNSVNCIDEAKKVMVAIAEILTDENARAVLVSEVRQLIKSHSEKERGDSDEICLLSLLYLTRHFSNLSDVKRFCQLTQSHVIAFSSVNVDSLHIRHLSQSSLYMLLTQLFFTPDISLIKRCLLDDATSYFGQSDNPQFLMNIVLHQISEEASAPRISSQCEYQNIASAQSLTHNWHLIIRVENCSDNQRFTALPVVYEEIIENSEFLNACSAGPFANKSAQERKSTELTLAKSMKSAICLIHLLHGCSLKCVFLKDQLKRSITLALELLELSCLVLCSALVKHNLYALLVNVYFAGNHEIEYIASENKEIKMEVSCSDVMKSEESPCSVSNADIFLNHSVVKSEESPSSVSNADISLNHSVVKSEDSSCSVSNADISLNLSVIKSEESPCSVSNPEISLNLSVMKSEESPSSVSNADNCLNLSVIKSEEPPSSLSNADNSLNLSVVKSEESPSSDISLNNEVMNPEISSNHLVTTEEVTHPDVMRKPKLSPHNVAHLLASAIKKYDESFLRLCLAHIFSADKRSSSGVYTYAMCKVVLCDSFQSNISLMGVDKMNQLVKHLVMEKLTAIR